MKKLTSILLAALLILSFAGCKDDGGDVVTGGNGGDFTSFKNVSRECVDAIGNGFSTLSDNYDDDFYGTDAAMYTAYMTKGNDLITGVEYVFSGTEDEAKRNLEEILYLSDVVYNVSGGTATITGTGIDGEDAKVIVKYDGSQSGQVDYYANETLSRSISFVTGNGYNATLYYDDFITTVNVAYSNGDVYYAFDSNGASEKVSLMDNKTAPSDKSFVTNNRQYIALESGSFVNTTK